jgi:hypothetical protein
MQESEYADEPGEMDEETAGVRDGGVSNSPYPPPEEAHRLVRAFVRIRKADVRERLLRIAERLSNE